MPPPVLLDEHPPHRVGADAVHPLGGRRDVADEVEAARHDLVEAEDGVDRADLRVHVAEPDEAVALDAVPEVFLHVEVHGVGAGLPDAVEAFVVAPERADVGQVADLQHRAHLAELRRATFGSTRRCARTGNRSGRRSSCPATAVTTWSRTAWSFWAPRRRVRPSLRRPTRRSGCAPWAGFSYSLPGRRVRGNRRSRCRNQERWHRSLFQAFRKATGG